MNEYVLRVLNKGDHQKDWSDERHREFVRKCEAYIGGLQSRGRLRSAQPLVKEGAILSMGADGWNVRRLDVAGEIQTGFYFVRADNLQDAIEIAKGNPEFEYSATARVEVRPLKAEEVSTGFVYPA